MMPGPVGVADTNLCRRIFRSPGEYLDKHAEYPDDTAFVEDVIQRCVNDALFTESMIRAGWLAIANHAQNALQAWKKGEKL